MSQRVLVTAGAAGIGLAIARAFAATGAQVFVADIDVTALASVARESPLHRLQRLRSVEAQ